MCVWAHSAIIVQQFTIDTVRLVNSVFKQHHMAGQMWARQRGLCFFSVPATPPTPPLFFPFTFTLFRASLPLSVLSLFWLWVRGQQRVLYSFPVSILWWDSPDDYASLSHPSPLTAPTQFTDTDSSETSDSVKQSVFCFAPRCLSVTHRWRYHAQMKMLKLLLCLVLRAHINIQLFFLLLSNNAHTDLELASSVSLY